MQEVNKNAQGIALSKGIKDIEVKVLEVAKVVRRRNLNEHKRVSLLYVSSYRV